MPPARKCPHLREIAAKFIETYVKPPATLVYHSHSPVECELEDQERHRFVVTYCGKKQEITGQGSGPLDVFIKCADGSIWLGSRHSGL